MKTKLPKQRRLMIKALENLLIGNKAEAKRTIKEAKKEVNKFYNKKQS